MAPRARFAARRGERNGIGALAVGFAEAAGSGVLAFSATAAAAVGEGAAGAGGPVAFGV